MANRFGGIGSDIIAGGASAPSFLNQIPTPWAPCDVGDDSVRSHNVHPSCRSDYRCPHRLVFHQANINFEKSSSSKIRLVINNALNGKMAKSLNSLFLLSCVLSFAVLTVIVENTHVNRGS